jgi:ATP phosphoribosyltransferase
MARLRLGIPKGSLQESTLRIFKRAGFNVSVSERSYFPKIDDEEIEPILLRAQEISRYVEQGFLDCGITGEDWIRENSSKVIRVANLIYAKQGLTPVRWVLAVPENSHIKKVKDLCGKRIATELVKVTKDFLRKNKVTAKVEFSWGATEAKVAAGLVDAVVELTETGSSLRAHNLRCVLTVCESTTQFIANSRSYRDSWKKKKICQMATLLVGAVSADNMVGLKMNVQQARLKKILSILPALKNPTISHLSKKDWLALETVIDEGTVRNLIPRLKEAGAEGIIEYSLNKLVY